MREPTDPPKNLFAEPFLPPLTSSSLTGTIAGCGPEVSNGQQTAQRRWARSADDPIAAFIADRRRRGDYPLRSAVVGATADTNTGSTNNTAFGSSKGFAKKGSTYSAVAEERAEARRLAARGSPARNAARSVATSLNAMDDHQYHRNHHSNNYTYMRQQRRHNAPLRTDSSTHTHTAGGGTNGSIDLAASSAPRKRDDRSFASGGSSRGSVGAGASIRVYIKLVSSWEEDYENPPYHSSSSAPSMAGADATAMAPHSQSMYEHEGEVVGGASPAAVVPEDSAAVTPLPAAASDDGSGGVGRASEKKSASRVPWEHSILSHYSELNGAGGEEEGNEGAAASATVGGVDAAPHGVPPYEKNVGASDDDGGDVYSPVAARRIDLDRRQSSAAASGKPPTTRGSNSSHDAGVGGAEGHNSHYSYSNTDDYNDERGNGGLAEGMSIGGAAYHPSWAAPFVLVSSVDLATDTIDACVIKAMATAAAAASGGEGDGQHSSATSRDVSYVSTGAHSQQHTYAAAASRGSAAASVSSTIGNNRRAHRAAPYMLSAYDVFLADKNGYIVGRRPLLRCSQSGGTAPPPIGSIMGEAYAAAAAEVERMESETDRQSAEGHSALVGDGVDGGGTPPAAEGHRLAAARALHQRVVDSFSDYTPLPPFTPASEVFLDSDGYEDGEAGLAGFAASPLNMRRSLVVIPRPPRRGPSSSFVVSTTGGGPRRISDALRFARDDNGGCTAGSPPFQKTAECPYARVYKAMNAEVAARHGAVERCFAKAAAAHRTTVVAARRAANEAQRAEASAVRQLAAVLASYKAEDNRLVRIGLEKKAREAAAATATAAAVSTAGPSSLVGHTQGEGGEAQTNGAPQHQQQSKAQTLRVSFM